MAAVVSTASSTLTAVRETQRTHDYRCSRCGYGIAVKRLPAECPMCRGAVWEQEGWRPFSLNTSFTGPARLRPGATGRSAHPRRGSPSSRHPA